MILLRRSRKALSSAAGRTLPRNKCSVELASSSLPQAKSSIGFPIGLFLFLVLALPSQSQAFNWHDYQFGISLGYGGAGISAMAYPKDPVTGGLQTTPVSVSRSEGPGVISFFIDKSLSDTLTFGLEHSRGFRLGPASTDASFTGIASRWFYSKPKPTMPAESETGNRLFIKNFVPYVGYAFGLAQANIYRSNDLVDRVSGSGVYMGGKFGYEAQYEPGRSFRYEVMTNTTFMAQGADMATLQEFALQVAWIWQLQ